MTVRQTRILFCVFFAFAIAIAINTLFLQSGSQIPLSGRQAMERQAQKDRQERLMLQPVDAAVPVSAPPVRPGINASAQPQIINGQAPQPASSQDGASAVQQKTSAAPRVVATAAMVSPAPDDGAKRFARLRPDALRFGAGVDTMPLAPDAEGDPATVAAVQRELSARGYGPLTADGRAGLMTRAAIMAFEHDNGLVLAGEATETILARVLLGVAPGAADASEAGRVRGPNAEALVRTVQQSLVALGYQISRIDGRMGDDTARAIATFESNEGLKPKGRISAEVFGRLARAVSSARVQPIR